VSKSTRHRSRRVVVIELFIFPVVIFLLGGQARSSPASHAQPRMVRAVNKTFREGIHAQLPPHLSTLLGISAEKECLVMQGVVRTGRVVQGFDVSMVNKDPTAIRGRRLTVIRTSIRARSSSRVRLVAEAGRVQV